MRVAATQTAERHPPRPRRATDVDPDESRPSIAALATTSAFVVFLVVGALGHREAAPTAFLAVFVGALGLLTLAVLLEARSERARLERARRIALLERLAGAARSQPSINDPWLESALIKAARTDRGRRRGETQTAVDQATLRQTAALAAAIAALAQLLDG